jgi:hypothetical protein
MALALAVATHAQVPATPSLISFENAPYGATPNYVRLGVPIAFSGRILPPDATGTLTFTVNGAPVQTSTLATQTLGDYIALGDSITAANYIADPAQRYQAIVGSTLNLTTTGLGIFGYAACDVMPAEVLPNNVATTPAASPLFSIMIGSNDYNIFGSGAHEAVFNLCYQADVAWIGVARANKVLIGDAGVAVISGQWNSASALTSPFLNALTNTSGSGAVRFTLTTTGNPAYLWYQIQPNSAGAFTVSVDGGAASAPVQTEVSGTGAMASPSYALLRLPVAAGLHTFDITAQTAGISVLAMGSPGTSTPPTVLAADVSYGLNQSGAAGYLPYIADIQANIALLQSDGLDVRFVPTRQYMFGTPAEMMDQRHPNALGLSEIAQAFLAAVTPAAPAVDTVYVASASLSTSSLLLGGNLIGMHYSGDAKYAPADNGWFVVVYDATSSSTLTSDAAIYNTQSPVTLTGAVPSANATGAVTFLDTTNGTSTALGSAWLSANSATLTLPGLSAGQHTLVAQYAGDIHYNGSASAPITITVSGASTSIALTSPATSFFGTAPVPLTATVTPSSATGTITFYDGRSLLAQQPVVSGIATCSATSLAVGTHTITAAYSGNSTQDAAQSPALSIEVNAQTTTTALTLPPRRHRTDRPYRSARLYLPRPRPEPWPSSTSSRPLARPRPNP